MKKYQATLYLRRSDKKRNGQDDIDTNQKRESETIENQRKFLLDFVKKQPDIEVISEKIDDGYSGLIFDRPDFQDMMKDIADGLINCVIVKDLSRLGREYIDTGRYLRETFPAYGVRFIAVNDGVDTISENTADELTVSMKNIINEAYCRDVSLKTRSALAAKRGNGEYVGAIPIYGYQKSKENRNQLVIDSFAAGIVKDIYRMRLEGFSALHIAEELNRLGIASPLEYKKANGVRCPKGGFADKENAKWSATTVIRILQDETYTGVLAQGKQTTAHYKMKNSVILPQQEWIRTPNAHPCIISKHDFDLVQRIRQLDTRTSPGGKQVYLFSGLLICGCCGNRITRKTLTSNGTKYFYYHCPTGKKNGCTTPMTKESDLISCVLEILKIHINSVVTISELLENISIKQINRQLAEQYNTQIQCNNRKIEQISHYKAGLYENFLNGVLAKDEYLMLKTQYSNELLSLSEANQLLEQQRNDILSGTSERNRWIEHFKRFSNMQELDRKAVVQLIRFIRIDGKKALNITFNYQDEYLSILEILKACKEAV